MRSPSSPVEAAAVQSTRMEPPPDAAVGAQVPMPSTTAPSALLTTSAPAASAPAETVPLCPKCQTKLVDAAGLGLCAKCGYCRSLEEDRGKVAATEPVVSPAAARGEFFRLMLQLPIWLWLLLLGMAMFAVASYFTGKHLPPDSLQRAVWCTAQIAGGLVLILAAQFWALMALAHVDEKLGTKDALLPTRLWPLIVQRLPAMRWHLWIAGWGLSLIVSGIIFIGGLSHWMTYLPGTKTAQATAKMKK